MRLLTGLSLGFGTGVLLSFTGSYLALPLGIISIIGAVVIEIIKKKKQNK